MFFRDYLNKRLKDKAFRREYKAVERNEARKASRTRKSQAKLHSISKKLSGHVRKNARETPNALALG